MTSIGGAASPVEHVLYRLQGERQQVFILPQDRDALQTARQSRWVQESATSPHIVVDVENTTVVQYRIELTPLGRRRIEQSSP